MPYINGIELTSVLRRRMPDVRIILLTMYEEVLDYKSLMAAKGLDAAIPKMECVDTLAECVRGLLPRATETPLSTNGPQAWR
jgi:DNA-binding NarL/FixJ family response regulator